MNNEEETRDPQKGKERAEKRINARLEARREANKDKTNPLMGSGSPVEGETNAK